MMEENKLIPAKLRWGLLESADGRRVRMEQEQRLYQNSMLETKSEDSDDEYAQCFTQTGIDTRHAATIWKFVSLNGPKPII